MADDPAQRTARHKAAFPGRGAPVCRECGLRWPCDVALRAAALVAEQAAEQINRLAAYIMAEVPGEPCQSKGAGDTAIRIIGTLRTQLATEQAARARAEERRALYRQELADVLLCCQADPGCRCEWPTIEAALAGEEER